MTDRMKIEKLCKLCGCKVKRLNKSTIIENRRFYWNEFEQLDKVIEYTGKPHEYKRREP